MHCAALRNCRVDLVKAIKPDELLDFLEENQVLTKEMVAEILVSTLYLYVTCTNIFHVGLLMTSASYPLCIGTQKNGTEIGESSSL